MRLGSDASARPALRAVAGFACNQGFVFSLFYMGANEAVPFGPFSFERAELFGVLAFMVVALVALRVLPPKARAALLAKPLLWCYAALLVVGSTVPALVGGDAAGLAFESAAVGLPAGLMLAAWGRALSTLPPARFAPTVFVASAVGAVVCFAAATVPVPFAPLALNLLPLGSAAALRGFASEAASKAPSDAAAPREAASAEASQLSAKIVAGTVVFGLAAGFMETYSSDPGLPTTPTFPVSLLLFVLFCIAALQLINDGGEGDARERGPADRAPQRGEGPLDGVYRLAILVMMAGFLFVPVLAGFGVPGEAIVLAGYLGLSAVLVSLFLFMGRITGRGAVPSFARGFAALYAGELIGIALGNALDAVAGGGPTPYAVVACAGLAALFAYLFLFTERDFSALSRIAHDADRFDAACAAIAAAHGLSKREAELLPLALKGRTGERIAAELFISKSTVDTHLRRIYAKCGVHNRQELIDLGEREQGRRG